MHNYSAKVELLLTQVTAARFSAQQLWQNSFQQYLYHHFHYLDNELNHMRFHVQAFDKL